MANPSVDAFIVRWSDTEKAERANKDLFLTELCDLLELPHPDPAGPSTAENTYVFERSVPLHQSDGRITTGKIDLYRRDCFVLEAKQTAAADRPENQPAAQSQVELALQPDVSARTRRANDPYGRAMLAARVQAERYAHNLPDSEPPPPFLIVLDVGHSIELFADFTQKGKAFLPFPDARSHRLLLSDLRSEKTRDRLRAIWLDPRSLDPARASAEVTRQAARHLAELAKSFEQSDHEPRLVAAFLTRCLFCMFAEDVGLLPARSFHDLLHSLRPMPQGVAYKLETLFRELNTGTPFSTVLNVRLLHFNGGLFADASALPVNGTQLGLLIEAARLQWRDVEPAIFGTLLERALDPAERHKLGAHYTPRAYVERLVLPAVIDPLRAEWANVLAAALSQAESGRTARAQEDVFKFHRRLCSLRVLDPACGSGNFLYVTLAHFKLLEGEVLDAYERFGGARRTERGPRGIGAETVDPHQFIGLELNPRAAALAELVLWIGYLQWHFRTFGQVAPAEPVLRNFCNIEHRDAVLACDEPPQIVTRHMVETEGPAAFPGLPENWTQVAFLADEPAHPTQPLTLWDRHSTRVDPVTGREVPDETQRVPFYRYRHARPAEWPEADYVVGNPPFIGNKMMRDDLGEAYTATLRAVWPAVPGAADFVMYWWHHAAQLAREGRISRFGLITTNSLRQTYNRSILAGHLAPASGPPLRLRFAIPDHPWVDTADGAAVRIAMTVGERADTPHPGELVTVVREQEADGDDGEVAVELATATGTISAALTVGADVSACVPLRANRELAFMGAKLVGNGFIVTPAEAHTLGLGQIPGLEAHIKPFRNGRDLTEKPRGVMVIDLFGLTEDEVRIRFPAVYEHLLRTVKPVRAQNKRASYRDNWWIFAEPRAKWRASVAGLSRYLGTSEVGKHRCFVGLASEVFPDGALIAINLDDAFHHGVLRSRLHVTFALAAGGRMGMGNDPRYQPTRCFDPFPFPVADAAQRSRIAMLAEEIDRHVLRAQSEHGFGLTAIYNVVESLRAAKPLKPADQTVHDRALVSTLRHLHDALDAAVAEAYGWPWPLTNEDLLARLVALNATRAAEESQGKVRWLRPAFQAGEQSDLRLGGGKKRQAKPRQNAAIKKSRAKPAWPAARPAQVEAVANALAAATAPVTAKELAATFARGRPAIVAEILAALVTLGRATGGDKPGTFTTS